RPCRRNSPALRRCLSKPHSETLANSASPCASRWSTKRARFAGMDQSGFWPFRTVSAFQHDTPICRELSSRHIPECARWKKYRHHNNCFEQCDQCYFILFMGIAPSWGPPDAGEGNDYTSVSTVYQYYYYYWTEPIDAGRLM